MLRSKEEIFNEKSWEALGAISPSKDFCLRAMEEYAKGVAIDFAEWIDRSDFILYNTGWVNEASTAPFQTNDLFELYLKQNNEQQ